MHDDDEGIYYEDDQPLKHVTAIISGPPDGYTDGDRDAPEASAGQTIYLAPSGLLPVDVLPKFESSAFGRLVAR